MRVRGDSPPTEAELSELFGSATAGPSNKPAERTWGDTFTDALPLAGGIVGGIVGAPGGIPGIMAGSAVGGGLGEAARQRVRGEDLDAGDIASTAVGEGVTAGAFGLAGKYAARIIRGVRKIGTAPGDVVTGVFKNLPGSSIVKGIGRETDARKAREALGRGRLNTSRVNRTDDALREALEEIRTAVDAPTRIGGSRPLTGTGRNVALDPEVRGGMVSTQPDKWGVTTIRPADDVATTLRDARGGSGRPPRPLSIEELTEAYKAKQAAQQPRQQLTRELLRSEIDEPFDDIGGSITRAGRSMMTPDELRRLTNAIYGAR